MIRNNFLLLRNDFYPLGNTATVSLTQDLPPEQDAHILLLGCGDARNILFTCFADNARKMDLTCCDIEPAIHARNILLYTLLIDDDTNSYVDRIWNIYYHWKLDEKSLKLLETQIQKLLEVSESIDQWHQSVYGSNIRFCDVRSLSFVRSHWKGYQSEGLPKNVKQQRKAQLEAAFHDAQTGRKKRFRTGCFTSDTRIASPVGENALFDVSDVTNKWWEKGTTLPVGEKHNNFNPTFLYSPDKELKPNLPLSPIDCFPLCTAYVPISTGSPFRREYKSTTPTNHIVDCAKIHFSQWALAFRKAVKNNLVIRVFSGDALAFCATLYNCQITASTSMNLSCDSWTNSRLELHHSEYGSVEHTAPLIFDIIDTSNLADHLGPLNVITATSCLLKHHASSTLYTQILYQRDTSRTDRLFGFFGVDTRTLALVLGLVLPDLFTNATDGIEDEDDCAIDKFKNLMTGVQRKQTCVRSRLRWKRIREGQIRVQAKALGKLLVQVHNAMFKHEDPKSRMVQFNAWYTRASFALLLSLIRTTVVTDWAECVQILYDSVFSSCVGHVTGHYSEDLLLNMHLYGVDNGSFKKPSGDVSDAILMPILPEELPEVLCVTVRVCREQLNDFISVFPNECGNPALIFAALKVKTRAVSPG